MKKVTGARLAAYIIDSLIVALIASLFAGITLINPNKEKMEELEEEYTTSTIENFKNQDYSFFNDSNIENMTYEISYYGIYASVIELVVMFLYFGLFQYYNKGQTIGKKLLKIEVVSTNKKKLKLYQIIIRSGIINGLLTSSLAIIGLLYLSKASFLHYDTFVGLLNDGLEIACIIMILYRSDGIGLHDLLASTRVISCADRELFEKENNIKEAKVTIKKAKKEIE